MEILIKHYDNLVRSTRLLFGRKVFATYHRSAAENIFGDRDITPLNIDLGECKGHRLREDVH